MTDKAKLLDIIHMVDTLNWLDDFCPGDTEWRFECEPGKARIVNDSLGELLFEQESGNEYTFAGGTNCGTAAGYDTFEQVLEFVHGSFLCDFTNL